MKCEELTKEDNNLNNLDWGTIDELIFNAENPEYASQIEEIYKEECFE
jgi:hypothetical protein